LVVQLEKKEELRKEEAKKKKLLASMNQKNRVKKQKIGDEESGSQVKKLKDRSKHESVNRHDESPRSRGKKIHVL